MSGRRRLRAVLTAGGTREPIDDVRHIRNVATGALPAAMAERLLARGWEVHHLHGPGAVLPGELRARWSLLGGGDSDLESGLEELAVRIREGRAALGRGRLVLHAVETAAEAERSLRAVLAEVRPELVACAMAVADWAPAVVAGKIGSRRPGDGETLTLRLRPTPKVIDVVRQVCPGARLLGFKLLSGASEAEHEAAAAALASRSGADLVFGNDMADHRLGRRRGVLRGPAGEALERLEGGQGAGASGRLAEALVAAALRTLGLDAPP